ncbi:MAG: hypothetical protein GYA20_09765 [Chloroflexi bacterium]|jgi:hypothetical protein|nr:hypothetical protein [Chloroflexota bacterium]
MTENTPRCLVCQETSQEIPLLKLEYQEQEYYICPQHFPILIHQPQKLVGLLPGAEKLQGHEH